MREVKSGRGWFQRFDRNQAQGALVFEQEDQRDGVAWLCSEPWSLSAKSTAIVPNPKGKEACGNLSDSPLACFPSKQILVGCQHYVCAASEEVALQLQLELGSSLELRSNPGR